jgi:hypothetical protein
MSITSQFDEDLDCCLICEFTTQGDPRSLVLADTHKTWHVLLDNEVILSKSRAKWNPMSGTKHQLKFLVKTPYADGVLPAEVDAEWKPGGLSASGKWVYQLRINDIPLEPVWTRAGGAVKQGRPMIPKIARRVEVFRERPTGQAPPAARERPAGAPRPSSRAAVPAQHPDAHIAEMIRNLPPLPQPQQTQAAASDGDFAGHWAQGLRYFGYDDVKDEGPIMVDVTGVPVQFDSVTGDPMPSPESTGTGVASSSEEEPVINSARTITSIDQERTINSARTREMVMASSAVPQLLPRFMNSTEVDIDSLISERCSI